MDIITIEYYKNNILNSIISVFINNNLKKKYILLDICINIYITIYIYIMNVLL